MLPLIQKTFPSLKQKLEKKQRKDHIKELKEICHMLRRDREVINEIDLIGAIKAQATELAMEETLKKEEEQLQGEFKDLFEPIPYIDKLPRDCVAKIELIDPTVKSHSYPCSHRYCDGRFF